MNKILAKDKIELTARLAKSRCEQPLEARGCHGTRTPNCRQTIPEKQSARERSRSSSHMLGCLVLARPGSADRRPEGPLTEVNPPRR